MDKMLVVVFDTETAAYEGLSALEELHREGSIAVYSTAVVVKDASGTVSVKREDDAGPVGTALGILTGSLVGLLAGPIGVAVGASATGTAGLLLDLSRVGINADFVDEVSMALIPGKAAVLAEVEETWVTPVDTRMGKLGGLIFRRSRSEVIDDQLAREAAALDAELTDLDEELTQASEQDKAAIKSKIADAQKKLAATQARIEARQKQVESEMAAKVGTLRAQMAQASGQQAAKNEQRIAQIKADYEVRRAKLAQAHKLIKEALIG